ncbi:hypothetical protein [Paracraurococcus ruber]|uniref:Uncharacterized protein n=1 Tax=Paracraurococcus ruber TaxID=77675 RepID=A0ABS1D6I4_9PROT|nr:hypothetical protein [Paracraurococcus ruber]MBK1662502.1 hypothetical protein [Paracraurococcus ruber]TDG27475.1 hypothetical protein E2C05_22790 [Paracraurococcus ruber]
MALFTVLVGGRPVLVFAEEDQEAATELATSLIGPDLQEFESGGQPVWDGQAPLSVRAADAAEAARWREGLKDAQEDGTAGEDPDDFAVFLLDLDEEE